ncbi:cadherin domain-containing protein, partial [Comamonas endophytica]
MRVNQSKSLNIVERLKDGSIVHIPVAQQSIVIVAKPGAQYALIDMATGKSPSHIVVKRKGNALVIEEQDSSRVLAELHDFHDQPDAAFIPQAELRGSALEGAALTAESPVMHMTAGGEPVIWMDSENDSSAALLFGLLGAGGVALAAGGGGGSGSGNTGGGNTGGGSGNTGGGGAAVVSNTVVGTIVAGPVVAGNDLHVEVFQADGITRLGESAVNADGSFSVAIGSYMGVVIARVVNKGANADYLDEATQTLKNLDAKLSGIEVVTEPNSTVAININAIATLSYLKIMESAGGSLPSAALVASVNQAIAELFSLPGLHGMAVVPTNGGAFDAGNGMSAGEAYGAILAALSGADALNGGDSQKSIEELLAGLTVTGISAALTEMAQAQLVKGAEHTSGQTGQSLAGFVAGVVDTYAPHFNSGSASPAVDENIGAARTVYTAVANDAAGSVTYSLKPGADAALFRIDAGTGTVTLLGNPDYETKPRYSFTVVATDAVGNASEQVINLAINNLDDTAPAITSGGMATAIAENSGAGQVVYTVTSTDSADVSTGSPRYSLKAGLDASLFSIDAGTGAVKLTGNPDYETKSSYSFTVVATDAAGNASEQVVTLAINDLDESAPVAVPQVLRLSIGGSLSGGSNIYKAGDSVLVTVMLNQQVVIDNSNGMPRVALDIGGRTVYATYFGGGPSQLEFRYRIVAGDSSPDGVAIAANALELHGSTIKNAAGTDALLAHGPVANSVVPVDAVAPVLTSGAKAAAIDENSGAGQIVYTAAATDINEVFYRLKPGADADRFSIDARTGAVTLTGNPDYETKPSYSFTVVATDAAGNASEQVVTLAINDLDDTGPILPVDTTAPTLVSSTPADNATNVAARSDIVLTFSEDVIAGSGDIVIRGDSPLLPGRPGRISLRTISVDDTSLVAVDGNRVTINLGGDLEPGWTYYVQMASGVFVDRAGNAYAGITSTTGLNFAMGGSIEVEPTVSSVSIGSTEEPGSVLNAGDIVYVTVTLSEAVLVTGAPRIALDIGGSTVYATYSSGSGTAALVFQYIIQAGQNAPGGIGTDSNALQLNGGTLKNAAGTDVMLAHGPAQNLDYQVDTVAPRLISGSTAFAIDENSGAGQIVYTAAATDINEVFYRLKPGADAEQFSIDARTGAVKLTGNPDYETKSSYSFTVVATDAAGNASEQAVTLAINDLDESAPVVAPQVLRLSIGGSLSGGSNIYKAGDSVLVTVMLDQQVVIDNSNGTPRVALDIGGHTVYATYFRGGPSQLEFRYRIVAGDSSPDGVAIAANALELHGSTIKNAAGTDALLAHGPVANSVVPIDAVAPVLTSGAKAAAIDENSGVGQIVYTAAATDINEVFYGLKPGADAEQFSIDARTGAVTLTGNPDYETKPSYSFTVVATDAAGNSSEQVVTLAINDLTGPVFAGSSAVTAEAVNENRPEGTVVYTAQANDANGVTYRLGGTDALLFAIDADGVVKLTGRLDYETKQNYSFTVMATDSAGNASSQVVTLPINDRTGPVFASGATAEAIAESSALGTTVYTAVANDASGVSYSLSGTDAEKFEIDAASGDVRLIGGLDYETKQSYSFTVVATDGANNASSQAVMLPINDRTGPVFASGATAEAIAENSALGTTIYTAVANDASGVSYSLSGTDAEKFEIDVASGDVRLIGSLDYETKQSYNFTVVATDGANNASSQAVTLPINDRTGPVFASGAIATAQAIDENSGAGQIVYTAAATDSNEVTYSLKPSMDAERFSIDASTGAVTLIGNPDYEAKAGYSFTVVATDAASNASEQVVTLAINDLDEVAPAITSGGTATAIDENSGAGQVVYTVTSDDSADVSTGSTRYSLKLEEGTDGALFSIDEVTGAVTLIGNPDHETKDSYSFTVVATDAASNASEQVVTLAINNVDDTAPAITSGGTATAIDENSGAGQVVYTVTSTDDADVSTGSTRYSLKLGEGTDGALFSIDEVTGAVTLIGNPDHETKDSYSFTVVATDAAGNASEQEVTLAINDLDEVAPAITSGGTATAIDENSGAGQVVYTVTSTDENDVSTGTTSYSLKPDQDRAAFSINASTGAVTLIGNPDFETKSSYSFTVVATDAAGNDSEQAVTLTINDLDGIVATVTSVAITGSTEAPGRPLNAGDAVFVTVTLSEPVQVTGIPRIALEIGGTRVYADYVAEGMRDAEMPSVARNSGEPSANLASRSGTTALVFQYTILDGQNDGDGIAITADALDLHGGTIKNMVGNDAVLTHDPVDANPGYPIDTMAPRVSNVALSGTSYGEHSILSVGDVVFVTVTLNETIFIDTSGGTPYIALTIGAETVNATYVGDNVSSQLVFQYQIEAGQTAASGIAIAANALQPNGGTFKDAAGNDAVLTHALVPANAAYQIDTTPPQVSSVALGGPDDSEGRSLRAGDTVSVTVTLDENTFVDLTNGSPRIALTIGAATVYASYVSGSGTSHLLFQYTIEAGQNDVNGIAIAANALEHNGGTLQDAAGNNAVLTHVEVSSNYQVDTMAPQVSSVTFSGSSDSEHSILNAGDTVSFTVTLDEDTFVDLTNGTPRIALTIGAATVYASYVSGSGTSHLLFQYTIEAGQTDVNGIAIAANALEHNGGTLQDAAGNNAVLTHVEVSSNYQVDTMAPQVSSVTFSGSSDSEHSILNAGDTVSVTVTLDEDTFVDLANGTPRIALTIGAATVYASYVSGSGTSHLLFQYTIEAGQTDVNGIAIAENALALDGGALRDAAGNEAALLNRAVADNPGYLVDTTAPQVSNVNLRGSNDGQNRPLSAGDIVRVTVTLSEAVQITDEPRIALTIGTTQVFASFAGYAAGSNRGLVFEYTILQGQNDADGIAIGALDFNDGAISDLAGNAAGLTHAFVNGNTGYVVDTVPRVLAVGIGASRYNGPPTVGDSIELVYQLTVGVQVTGTPRIAMTLGTTEVLADYVGYYYGRSDTLQFKYTIPQGQRDSVGLTIGTLDRTNGTVSDLAGNDIGAALDIPYRINEFVVDTPPNVVAVVFSGSNDGEDRALHAGDTVSVKITLTDAVQVSGTPRIALTIGTTRVFAEYVGLAYGNYDKELVFQYTILDGQTDTDGITVDALDLHGAWIFDRSYNAADFTHGFWGSNTGYMVDTTAPTLTSDATAAAIDEDSGAGQIVYMATVTEGDAVTYSLKDTDLALFSINAATGEVTLTGNPDHETKDSYSFTVVATDAAGNASEQEVTLAINDLDEVAPAITSGGTATAIDENSGAGQVVYTVISDDSADVSTGSTRYSLKLGEGTDGALFSINAATGEVTLIGNPDHETKDSYSFTVVATDAAGNASEQEVTLAINDLDEVAPAITSGGTATAIDENSGAGQVVYTVTSDDSADVSTGSTRYSLKLEEGTDGALFSID